MRSSLWLSANSQRGNAFELRGLRSRYCPFHAYSRVKSFEACYGAKYLTLMHSLLHQDASIGYCAPQNWRYCQLSSPLSLRRSETHFFTCIRLRGFPHDLHLRCVIANAIQLFLLLITETHLPQTKFAAKLFPYLFVNPIPYNVIGSMSGRIRLDHVGKARPLASGSAIVYCWLSHAPKAHISKVAWPARRATPEVNTLM